MAGQVDQRDAEISREHCGEHLQHERPVVGPDAVDRGDGGEHRQGGDAAEGEGFVHRGVDGVTPVVVVRGVPVLTVGQDAFRGEGAGDREQEQAEQPEFGGTGGGDGDAGAVDGQEHERHVAVPDERFHAVEPAGRPPVPA